MLASVDNPSNTWIMTSDDLEATETIYNYIKPFLKIDKDCGCARQAIGCWAKNPTKTLNGQVYRYGHEGGIGHSYCAAKLNDGTNISFDTWTGDYVGVETNNRSVFFFLCRC